MESFAKFLVWIAGIILLLGGKVFVVAGQQSSIVYPGNDNKLQYGLFAAQGEDTLVNRVPDWSYCGYMGGGVKLPDVPVVKIIEPIEGDNAQHIQDAIDEVSAMAPDANGFRGTILLKAGKYEVDGSLMITASGVVLRGEGQNTAVNGGTELYATRQKKITLLTITGDVEEPIDQGALLKYGIFLDRVMFPQAYNEWIDLDVKAGVEDELDGNETISFMLTDIDSVGDNCAFYSKEAGAAYSPFLVVTTDVETDTLNAVADVYVEDSSPDGNKNGDSKHRLMICSNAPQREIFLKFDLSNVAGNVTSAKLKLMRYTDNSYDRSNTYVGVYYMKKDDWEETTLTFNNRFYGLDQAALPERITSGYVGVGATKFTVENAAKFKVGDSIFIRRTPNQYWVDVLKCNFTNPDDVPWTPESYTLDHERVITNIKGDTVYINIPVIDGMQDQYGGGEILLNKRTGYIEQCGVENLWMSSYYASDDDESHGWNALSISGARNCWAKGVTAQYFGYSCVSVKNKSAFITVEDCAQLDPKSITTGGRKYSFPCNGFCTLYQRCYTRGGRHDFVPGARVRGPNAYVDCYSDNPKSINGPHQRWATGTLYDNIYGGTISVSYTGGTGTGHGWHGAQTMFWNLYVNFVVNNGRSAVNAESPPGAVNWAIGCKTKSDDYSGEAWWESKGTHVEPRSLYIQQLKDRLGEAAVDSVIIPAQQDGTIWDKLKSWGGVGSLEASFTGVGEPEMSDANMVVYPNPSTGNFTIGLHHFKDLNYQVEIIDINGTVVFSRQFHGENNPYIQASTYLKKGCYFVRVKNETNTTVKQIIII